MSLRTAEPNSIQARCSARTSGSAGCSGFLSVSSRYSRITADSKIALSPTCKTGVLPSGEIAKNQSGLLARSMSIRSNATPFSVSAITARCTQGQSLWLMSLSGAAMADLSYMHLHENYMHLHIAVKVDAPASPSRPRDHPAGHRHRHAGGGGIAQRQAL